VAAGHSVRRESWQAWPKTRLAASVILFVAALLVRVWLAYATPGAGYDIESYRIQAQAVLSGQNIYEVTHRHPYLPLWMYVPATAWWVAEQTGWPFHFWIKLPSLAADLGIGFLLWKILRRNGITVKAALLYAGFYLFNPVVLLVTVAHGQFDALVLFFVLLAIWWVEHGSVWRRCGAALSLGMAIALKGFPVLFLPTFLLCLRDFQSGLQKGKIGLLISGHFPRLSLGKRAKSVQKSNRRPSTLRESQCLQSYGQVLAFAGLVMIPAVLVSLPYLDASRARLLWIALGYSSTADHSYPFVLREWGKAGGMWAEALLTFLRAQARIITVLGVAFVTGMAWWGKRPLVEQLALIVLSVYVLAPGLASQQMLWLVSLLLVVSPRHAIGYSVVSTIALVVFYGIHFPEVLLLSSAFDAQRMRAVRVVCEVSWWMVCVGILTALLWRIMHLQQTPTKDGAPDVRLFENRVGRDH
jgi:hypothetical protein